jgi:hypothetical protein
MPTAPEALFAAKDIDAGEWRSLSPSMVEDLTCGDDSPIALFRPKSANMNLATRLDSADDGE